ncbi:MAG: hypothetical protein GDYSWBUE_000977 [Candidatus Fervidibacterota bacterium]
MSRSNDIAESAEHSAGGERGGKGSHTAGWRKGVRIFVLFAAVASLIGIAVILFLMLTRPTPEGVLNMALNAHSAMNAMHMKAQVSVEPLIKVPIEITADLERPNKLRGTIAIKGISAPSMLVVSDGKRMWTFVEQWKQCQVEPAPKDMAATWGAFKPVGAKGDHRENMAAALFCGFEPKGTIRETGLLKTENIGPHKCHVLRIVYTDGLEQLMHVGVRDGFVWQTSVKRRLPMPSPLPPIEITITSKCVSIVPNPKFGEGEFTFTPPKGTKMVESLTPPEQD